jgi:hypothetical protein
MMKKSLIAMLISSVVISSAITSLVSFSAQANDDTYTFVGVSLTHYNDLANLDLSRVDIDLVPEVSLGYGKNYQLNQDWLLSTKISLHYAKAHFSGFVDSDVFLTEQNFSTASELNTKVSGNYEALGLWATSRFQYMSFSENVTPFVELAIGAVETNHGTLFGEEKNRGIRYKAITGLAFEVANDVTFSIGFGLSDDDNNL